MRGLSFCSSEEFQKLSTYSLIQTPQNYLKIAIYSHIWTITHTFWLFFIYYTVFFYNILFYFYFYCFFVLNILILFSPLPSQTTNISLRTDLFHFVYYIPLNGTLFEFDGMNSPVAVGIYLHIFFLKRFSFSQLFFNSHLSSSKFIYYYFFIY